MNFAPVLTGNDKVLTIQSGFLSSFDITNKNIFWSDGKGYKGQPAFDGKFIYAVKNSRLIVLDQQGKQIWNWYKDNENIQSNIIVTDNLVFVSTQKNTYAISKKTREAVWNVNVSGELAMGMGHLYILDVSGMLYSYKIS